MNSEIKSYVNVAAKMAELGCKYPCSGIVLLPVNFAQASSPTELLQASDTATVKKLLCEADVPVEEILERSRRPMYIKNKSAEWSAPSFLFAQRCTVRTLQPFLSPSASLQTTRQTY